MQQQNGGCSARRPVVADWVGLYLDGVKDLINLIIPSFDYIADILERHPEWFLNAPEGGWWKRLEVPHNPASAKLWIQALRDGSMVQSKPRSYDFNPDPIPPGSCPKHNPIHDLRRGHPEATPEDDIPAVAPSPLGALCEVYRQQTGKGDWVNLTYYSGEHHSNKNQFIGYGNRKEVEAPEPVLEWAGLHEEGAEAILDATREGTPSRKWHGCWRNSRNGSSKPGSEKTPVRNHRKAGSPRETEHGGRRTMRTKPRCQYPWKEHSSQRPGR